MTDISIIKICIIVSEKGNFGMILASKKCMENFKKWFISFINKKTNTKRLYSITFFLLLAIILLSFKYKNSGGKSFAKESISLHVDFMEEGYVKLNQSKKDTIIDSAKVFYVKTKVKNNSSETIYFIGSTCSYEDMFVIRNTELFKFYQSNSCYKNSPTLISLKPDSTYINEIIIQSLVKESLIPPTCEIGFEFIQYLAGKEFDVVESYRTRHSEGNTIWSNSFELKIKK